MNRRSLLALAAGLPFVGAPQSLTSSTRGILDGYSPAQKVDLVIFWLSLGLIDQSQARLISQVT